MAVLEIRVAITVDGFDAVVFDDLYTGRRVSGQVRLAIAVPAKSVLPT